MNKTELVAAIAEKADLQKKDAEKAIEALQAVGEQAYVVGSVEAGEKGVTLC